MTKRSESKELYLAALRGDAKAQRACTEKGKQCGGRCIPKHWNCRIKGEGETPPTRGNRVQLSPEQRAKFEKIRNRRQARKALTAVAGAAAVGAAVAGAAAYGAKNPAKARRMARNIGKGGASEALGVVSAIGGPAAAGVAGVANLGVAGFQVGARMGAGTAQRRRAIGLYNNLLRQRTQLSSQLKTAKRASDRAFSKVLKAQENVETQKKIFEEAKLGAANKGKRRSGFALGQNPQSIAQTDLARTKNLTRSEANLRKANKALRDAQSAYKPKRSATVRLQRKLSSNIWKSSKLKDGLQSASNPIKNTIEESMKASTSGFRAGRRQISSFIRSQGRPGAPADPRSWQERFGLKRNIFDSAEREDKKCGNSGIPDNAKCTKKNTARTIAKAAAGAALVVGGAAALKNRRKIRSKFRKTGLTAYQKRELEKMRAKGTGKYGAQGKRSFSSEQQPFYSEADRIYPLKHKRLFRDSEAADAEGKKFSKTVTNPKTGRKRTVKYGAKGYSIAPGTNKGDRYCARSFGDMKSHNKNCAGKDRNTPLCLSRAKWKCSGKRSRRS